MTGRFAAWLGALAERNFRLLFLGRAISVTGDKIAPVALAFAVLDLTGSASDLGFVLSARVVAMVAFLLVGGVWADRLSRRAVLIGTDLLRFVTQGTTAVVLLTGTAAVWELVVLQAAAGAGQAFFRPASSGLVPSTVSVARLQQANALLGLAESSTNIVGPAVAGVLVATVGPGWAIALDAASYAASALFLLQLRVDEPRRATREPFRDELVAGWREFRSRKWLVALVGGYALYHLAVFAPFMVLGPLVSKRDLGGAAAWAAIMTAYGAGAVVGGALGLRLRPARPLVAVAAFFLLATGPLVALALTDFVAAIAGAAAISGTGSSFADAIWHTTLQRRIPHEALSRVSSYDWLGSMAFLPLGYAIVGPLADERGVEPVLWAGVALEVLAAPILLAVVLREAAAARRPSASHAQL